MTYYKISAGHFNGQVKQTMGYMCVLTITFNEIFCLIVRLDYLNHVRSSRSWVEYNVTGKTREIN